MVYGLALTAVLVAAVVDGFVVPNLAREIMSAAPPASEGWRIALYYNGFLNQAFARVFFVASSISIVLWSASILRTRALASGVAIYGLLVGPAVVIAVVSGLRLDPHGAGSLILGQSLWFDADGTITIYIDKSNVGNPQPGDLLGAVNGRTFNTGDTPPETLERSTLLIDHTFVKGNTDNSYPPATYTIVGNTVCSSGNIEPVDAVSRKRQGSAGNFDVDLPLTGKAGIEDRSGGTSANYEVIATFTVAVNVQQVTVTPGAGATASVSHFAVHHSQVIVDLTNVSNAQTLTIDLIGVTGGTRSGNVSIPMSVLIGDTNADGVVNSTDVSQTQAQSGNRVTQSNFREDVNADGAIDSADVALVQSHLGTTLH